MKITPSKNIINWFDHHNADILFTTTITVSEINYGLHALSDSKRKKRLEIQFNQFIHEVFYQRILNFDLDAAYAYGEIMAYRKKTGTPMSIPDGQIAAITYVQNASLATRNVKDFKHLEFELINPFNFRD